MLWCGFGALDASIYGRFHARCVPGRMLYDMSENLCLEHSGYFGACVRPSDAKTCVQTTRFLRIFMRYTHKRGADSREMARSDAASPAHSIDNHNSNARAVG